MQPKNFSFMHLLALIVAGIGAVIWLHLPSIYLRAMFGSGNTFTMAELWESMFLLRHLAPWVYQNSLVEALPFLHISMDMSVLFLVFLALGYIGNLAYALYHLDREGGHPFHLMMLFPAIPFPGIIAAPYVGISFFLLLIFQVLAAPIILFNVFVEKDTMHMVTLLAFIAIGVVSSLALKMEEFA